MQRRFIFCRTKHSQRQGDQDREVRTCDRHTQTPAVTKKFRGNHSGGAAPHSSRDDRNAIGGAGTKLNIPDVAPMSARDHRLERL
jgi:hypothetical protein